MTRKQKSRLLRILIAAAFLGVLLFIPTEGLLRYALYLLPYLTVGYDVLRKAVRGCFHGDIFDENFLMSLASIGAFALGDVVEAVAVLLFYQVGSLFEDYAVGKSRKSIGELMSLRPDFANVEREGKTLRVAPETVDVGETILVKTGERVPLDGIVTEGNSHIDTSALTGESLPRSVGVGDEILSGAVNQSGLLRIKTTRKFAESTVSRILALVETASTKKASSEKFISKFSRIYTPAVVGAAVLLAVLPSLIDGQWREWLTRALTFLVISCPCALVISVPLSFFGGIGGASKCGILMKGGNFLEALAKVKTVVFDKTGTLTKGDFTVTSICPEGISEEELLSLAAAAERYSDHPIALAIRRAYGKETEESRIGGVEELSGLGVVATVDGMKIAAGGAKLMQKEDIIPPAPPVGTVVYLAREGTYLGYLVISDSIKEGAEKAIQDLRSLGVERTVMLTGDRKETGEEVGNALHIDTVYTELLPAQKVERVEALLAEKRGSLAFVGDGINDAPVLCRADVGIAMGAIGSDAAIEAADVVLMDDKPEKLPLAIGIARRTLRIVRANIVFALGVKAVILLLGALGYADMWAAVFADVGVSVIAILNAMRALQVKMPLQDRKTKENQE